MPRHQPHLRTSPVPPTAVLDAAYHPPLALPPPLATRAPGCTRKRPTRAAQATTREDDDGTTRGRHERAWGERRKVSTPLHPALLTARPPDPCRMSSGCRWRPPNRHEPPRHHPANTAGPNNTRPLAACAVDRPNARRPRTAALSPRRTRVNPESPASPPRVHVPPLRAYRIRAACPSDHRVPT